MIDVCYVCMLYYQLSSHKYVNVAKPDIEQGGMSGGGPEVG